MKKYIGNNCTVQMTTYEQSIRSFVEEKAELHDTEQKEEAFFIGDLGDIITKYQVWKEMLPRVMPFYAVKCNDDYAVLKLLADMGTNFDCASKAEIMKVLDLGVDPSRIIYANPCKQNSYIKYAAKKHVDMMTFDNEDELHKVKTWFPEARLVLRILPPSNFKVQCELGNKYGCHPDKACALLEVARNLGLNVMGVSFHVGSGCEEAEAFAVAIQQARTVFDIGLNMGFNMTLLDIGGGFPGQQSAPVPFSAIAGIVNEALDHYFPASEDVEIIAEPGRYFVASAFILTVNIIAKRVVTKEKTNDDDPVDTKGPVMMYYVNDGVYGSFNCLLFDHAKVEVNTLQGSELEQCYTSSVWGPTCDGLDCILEECSLPELRVGHWLFFKDMGAYTMSAASTFNGMPPPHKYYLCEQTLWNTVYPEKVKKSSYIKKIPPMMTGHLVDEAHDFDDLFGTSPATEALVGSPFGF
ncbi:ornithine decarboxylase-like [Saccostrea echinata]|uniref:ornithine decarboxylase-like n=1 Tax=Saccostrea echinata TaxID=191078 RepID=UPI002A841E21|nr:ornithine decarboxylase-like [Saccostrea echinata]